jgi:ferredoxin-NADP reductase
MLTALIDHVHHETPRSLLVRLAPHAPFAFRAGQAALLGEHGRGELRPYSIAVGPHEAADRGRLEFLVGVGPDGSPGSHLPSPAAGTLVDVEGPIGTFRYPDRPERHPMLFVAGGTGIAPVRAMLHEALAAPVAVPLSLVYSARSPEEFAFDAELAALAGAGRLRYARTATRHADASWRGDRGRITRGQLEAALPDGDPFCFVCGPESLVHEVPRLLRELGVPRERIRVEEWSSR